MKTNVLRVITAIGAGSSAVAALNLGGLMTLFPPHISVYIIGASAGALALKEISIVIGDYIDDGNRNDSFK